jgi:hypothetical protein
MKAGPGGWRRVRKGSINEMGNADPAVQWTMNSTLAEIERV